MTLLRYPLSAIRHINRKCGKTLNMSEEQVQYFGQQANDIIREKLAINLKNKTGYMIAKFGTYELDTILFYTQKNTGIQAYADMIHGVRRIYWKDLKRHLPNMGFFPLEQKACKQFSELYCNDIPLIDILGSYQRGEIFLGHMLKEAIKVNLEGYYAPYLWNTPWTKTLAGKKVLVVHPLTESIQRQYARRKKLFDNPEVLPEFKELLTVKAVQSIAGNKPEQFETWFDALDYIKQEISAKDFDIALIGCGAYGLPLSAHVKRMGKIAIHLAGWTQMLFGIYGNRWLLEQTKFKQFINEYWIRPALSETPVNAITIENACYW